MKWNKDTRNQVLKILRDWTSSLHMDVPNDGNKIFNDANLMANAIHNLKMSRNQISKLRDIIPELLQQWINEFIISTKKMNNIINELSSSKDLSMKSDIFFKENPATLIRNSDYFYVDNLTNPKHKAYYNFASYEIVKKAVVRIKELLIKYQIVFEEEELKKRKEAKIKQQQKAIRQQKETEWIELLKNKLEKRRDFLEYATKKGIDKLDIDDFARMDATILTDDGKMIYDVWDDLNDDKE